MLSTSFFFLSSFRLLIQFTEKKTKMTFHLFLSKFHEKHHNTHITRKWNFSHSWCIFFRKFFINLTFIFTPSDFIMTIGAYMYIVFYFRLLE